MEKPADKPTEPVQAPAPAAPPPQPPSEAEGGEVSLIDSLADNPLTLPAAGLLVAGLIGLAGYRWRQRRKGTPVDSSFLESKIQPDSFFGSSGGQSIDTSEAVATGSSMMYSPSQLDAGGDVDPVAEADVYLAYGRDLQAEEILKEALRINPKRVAIHAKLLEIYAKRRDAKAYEVLACEVYALTGGQGTEWDAVCLQGQELDPANPLYQPGGKPAALADAPTGFQPSMMPPGMANTQPFMPLEEDPRPEATAPASVDLDLDFSIDDSPAPAQTAFNQNPPDLNEALGNEPLAFTMPEEGSASVPSAKPLPDSAFELQASDLEFSIPDEAPVSTLADPSPEAASPNEMALDFDFPNATDPMAGSPMDQTVRLEPTEPPAQLDDDHLMAFNTGEMPLDSGNGDSISPLDDIPEGDPLETKLSLAAEFMAIGDMEGARSLAEEVEEQATGRLKEKAKAFLADLG